MAAQGRACNPAGLVTITVRFADFADMFVYHFFHHKINRTSTTDPRAKARISQNISGMVLAREAYVHRENAYHQRGKHDGDGDDGERFNQPIQVVADDRHPRVHHAGQNVRVDFGLFVALAVFDEHVVDEFQALAADSDLDRIVLQSFDQLGIGIYAVEIVDQAFFQAEQVQEILILHGSVDLLFEGVGDRIDDLQVFVEMEDRTVDHLQA